MYITRAWYLFNYDTMGFDSPEPIVKETAKCYQTSWLCETKTYRKSEIGKVILRYPSNYPFLEIIMIDANEQTLREKLREWFEHRAERIMIER